MDKFSHGFECRIAADFFFQEIFDRLDVVVGGFLDGLNAQCIIQAEVFDDAVEQRLRRRFERRHFGNLGRSRQRLQPAHLDQHAVMDQAVLAEDRPQIGGLRSVATVGGGDRGEFV